MNRPSGELRVQYDERYVTSSRMRTLPCAGDVPPRAVGLRRRERLVRHAHASDRSRRRNRTSHRVVVVDRAPAGGRERAVCAATSAEMPGVHVVGAPDPAASACRACGRPRVNHSATMSNCGCVSGVTVSPCGIAASLDEQRLLRGRVGAVRFPERVVEPRQARRGREDAELLRHEVRRRDRRASCAGS